MGLHMPELLIVLVAALLIFGPKKLPEMGSAIGKSVKAFRKGVEEISNPQEAETLPPPSYDKDVHKETGTSSLQNESQKKIHNG